MSHVAGGWEIVCPDGIVRHNPYHNFDDAEFDAASYTERKCRGAWPKPSRLEMKNPPCPEGSHTVRPVVFSDVVPETGQA